MKVLSILLGTAAVVNAIIGEECPGGDSDCLTSGGSINSGEFCRDEAALNGGVWESECHTRASIDSACSLTFPKIECVNGAVCEEREVSGTTGDFCIENSAATSLLGATIRPPSKLIGESCTMVGECVDAGFCLIDSVTNTGTCELRATMDQECMASDDHPAWSPSNELQCLVGLTCEETALNANVWWCRPTRYNGETCYSHSDCDSPSKYCKKISHTGTTKECFARGMQGDRCTSPGYGYEWDERPCLNGLHCALNDANDPAQGGVCQAMGSTCISDANCRSGTEFCRRVSSSSFVKQCFPRSNLMQHCTIDAYTVDWETQLCSSADFNQPLYCEERDPNNPAHGGVCKAYKDYCNNDLDCDDQHFCRRDSSTSDVKRCHARASTNQACTAGYVAGWNVKKCVARDECVLTSPNFPELGGKCQSASNACSNCNNLVHDPVCVNGEEFYNECAALCKNGNYAADIVKGPCGAPSCSSDNDCQSTSFFCKRAMVNSAFKSCFVRSTEGQACTNDTYTTEWNVRKCLPSLYCVSNDVNAPGLGGTCQSSERFGCSVDSDCVSADEHCRRSSASSSFSSCVPRQTEDQECTIGTSVPEWNTKKCLATLYCWPLNPNNPSAGGVCKSEQPSGGGPNYDRPPYGPGGPMDNNDYSGYNNNNNNNYNNGYNNNNNNYNGGYSSYNYNNGYNNGYNNNNNGYNYNNNNNGYNYNNYNNYNNGYNGYNYNNGYNNNNNNGYNYNSGYNYNNNNNGYNYNSGYNYNPNPQYSYNQGSSSTYGYTNGGYYGNYNMGQTYNNYNGGYYGYRSGNGKASLTKLLTPTSKYIRG